MTGELEKALKGTFPASDPVSASEPAPADDPAAREPVTINPDDADDVAFWAGQLGVDAAAIKEAIRLAGTEVVAVTDQLKRK
jgi:hypothetical protein